jgi:hypothetical protein
MDFNRMWPEDVDWVQSPDSDLWWDFVNRLMNLAIQLNGWGGGYFSAS